MAYATLEEAWGQDYKSFLSPASLSPDWLEECKKKTKCASKAPTGFNTDPEPRFHYSDVNEPGTPYTEKGLSAPSPKQSKSVTEHFNNNTKPKRLSPKNEDEDYDLMLHHDEFNLPMHFESPEAIDPGLDDYYKLIDSEYNQDTLDSYRYPYQDTNYAEEVQFGDHYLKKAQKAYKINKSQRIAELLEELKELGFDLKSGADNTINTSNTSNKNSGIKSVFPDHLKGYIDLIFFIAVGIFLIFVLDTFVKLGKSFSKR